MKRLIIMAALVLAAGCEGFDSFTQAPAQAAPQPEAKRPEPPPRQPRLRPKANTAPSVESYATCSFDMLMLPRAEMHAIDQLFTYTETGGVYGPEDKVLGLNGLRVARADLRFAEPFGKALAAARANSKQVTLVRLPEDRAQTFDVGEAFKDVSLFVWTAPDAVLGRHFTQGRYALTLRLEKISPEGVAEYGLSWQINSGASFQRTIAIPSLDMHVELEKGQSLIIAPTGVSGRSVDRALLSGLDESAVRVTCIAITPTDVHPKPAPREAPADGEETATK